MDLELRILCWILILATQLDPADPTRKRAFDAALRQRSSRWLSS